MSHPNYIIRLLLLTFFSGVMSGCVSLPQGISPVVNFDVNRYLGKWYEIARIENRFEQGLNNVTAEYQTLEDGIKVINSGFNPISQQWQKAEGIAYSVEEKDVGFLKVSFFGPFYGGYIIFHLDQENYEYSFVAGGDKKYLWLLARKPSIDSSVKNSFIKEAKRLGFDLDDLIWVEHDKAKLKKVNKAGVLL